MFCHENDISPKPLAILIPRAKLLSQKDSRKRMPDKYFTIDARAMLTWGRDSIKDHTTALLELVKNGYDAGASIVEVEISVGENLTHDSLVRIADDGCGMS